MKNAWSYEIPRIAEVIDQPEHREWIEEVTQRMLGAAGKSPAAAQATIDFVFDKNSPRETLELERVLHDKIFSKGKDQNQVRDGMRLRARIISSQIERYFQGESLADVGCGHGLVGWSARKHFNDVLLLDIIDYRDAEVALPFVEYSANEDPPFGHAFDCTLLITVLHHAHAPFRLLESVWRQTRKRLIVIESVFGVTARNANSPLPGLDLATQLSYAVYCDWFYNRVLNQNVFVPYNFNTPENWRKMFMKLGARIHAEEDLGVDLDIVPEHHYLFVLDKEI